MTEPAFWRVTLTWPKPPEWDSLDAYGKWLLNQPEKLKEKFALQLQMTGGDVETLDIQPRTVRLVAKIPARKPQGYNHRAYQSSAQYAIDWTVQSAEFGARCVTSSSKLLEPLPEPVRINAVPVSARDN